MITVLKTAQLNGLNSHQISIEVAIEKGLPMYQVIGLGDRAVSESHERVKSAIINSGYPYPKGKITVNLSPASLKKSGSHYDLPIALGLISQELNKDLREYAFMGELSLSSEVINVRGILPMIVGLTNAWSNAIREDKSLEGKKLKILVPWGNYLEASSLCDDSLITVIPVKNLKEAVDLINNPHKARLIREGFDNTNESTTQKSFQMDFNQIKGNSLAKEAIVTAVAGVHGLLMIGSPGTGKSMLASRIPTILPPLSLKEKRESTMIYSLMGKLDEAHPIIDRGPFYKVLPETTKMELIGGGVEPIAGAISLAHNGVLYVDEMLEFERSKLELLRNPMEDRYISFTRRGIVYQFPASFILISATNPCRCGYLGHPHHQCKCSIREIEMYRNRISGPLKQRIDMAIEIEAVDYDKLVENECIDSQNMQKRVLLARQIQRERFAKEPDMKNGLMSPRQIEEFCALGKDEENFMRDAYEKLHLSPRRYHKVLRGARTVADLQESKYIKINHLATALGYTRILDDNNEV